MTRRGVSLAVLLLLAGCSPDGEPVDRGGPTIADGVPHHLLLITIDTLRADCLGCYGGPEGVSPTLDRLAREGVVFDRAYSVLPHTLPSHISLMTGEWPFVHGVRINGAGPLAPEAVTLAEQLDDAGFDTAGFPAAMVLRKTLGVEQGFDEYHDEGITADTIPPERTVVATQALFEDWLDRRGDDRMFAWLHVFEPHKPYTPPPDAGRRFSTPYLGEIHHADRVIGRILTGLKQRGLLQDTLVCVTSDHGEGLGDHAEETHGTFVYDSTMRVPLLLWHPSLAPGRVNDVVSIVDIAPTLLQLLDTEPLGCSGRSVVGNFDPRFAPPVKRPAYAESYVSYLTYGWSPIETVITADWKYISAPRPELYAIGSDPGEQRDLVDTEPATLQRMRAALEAIFDTPSPRLKTDGTMLSAVELERLRALGYALGPDLDRELPRPGVDSGPDPKDRTEVLARVQKLVLGQMRNDHGTVIRLSREILQLDPNNPYAIGTLGSELCGRREYAPAIQLLRRLVPMGRESAASMLSLAVALLKTGALEESAQVFERLDAVNPGDPKALKWRAELFEKQGDPDAALECYRLLLEEFEGPDGARQLIETQIQRLDGSGEVPE